MPRPVAIVTGSSRGIGRAIALRLAREGFDLVLAARTATDLEAFAGECEAAGASVLAVATDVSREEDVTRLFEATRARFGRLDLLVNNAGIGVFGPLVETTLEDFEHVMGVNLRGVFLSSREAMRWMKEAVDGSSGGTIVNVSSVVGIKGYANQAIYAASKHGVVGLTKVIAEEGREHGIRAHVICPGGVATEMVSQARPDIEPAELLQPEDVAELVIYLVKLPRRAMVDIVHLRRFTSKSF